MRLSSRITLRTSIALLIFGMSLTAAGCGSSTGKVTGKVSYKNAPLKGGNVTFMNEKKERFPAEIQENGSYSLAKVPPGEYKIAVETESFRPPFANEPKAMAMRTRPKEAQGGLQVEERAKRYTAIPPNYSDPDQSGLTYTVTSGSQEHDIPLK